MKKKHKKRARRNSPRDENAFIRRKWGNAECRIKPSDRRKLTCKGDSIMTHGEKYQEVMDLMDKQQEKDRLRIMTFFMSMHAQRDPDVALKDVKSAIRAIAQLEKNREGVVYEGDNPDAVRRPIPNFRAILIGWFNSPMAPYDLFIEAFDLCADLEPIDSDESVPFNQCFEFAMNQVSLIHGEPIALTCIREFFQKHQCIHLV